MATGIMGASFRSALGPELAGLLGDPAGRVGVPDVTCREVWDGVPHPVRERVIAGARAELERPEPRLTAGAWARAARDGDRGRMRTGPGSCRSGSPGWSSRRC